MVGILNIQSLFEQLIMFLTNHTKRQKKHCTQLEYLINYEYIGRYSVKLFQYIIQNE